VVEERAHETGRTDNFREESPQGENIEIVYVIEKALHSYSINQTRTATIVG
jgi:hypothetical protein